jgi:hypothetical protein
LVQTLLQRLAVWLCDDLDGVSMMEMSSSPLRERQTRNQDVRAGVVTTTVRGTPVGTLYASLSVSVVPRVPQTPHSAPKTSQER